MEDKKDITLVGFAVNPEAAGKDNKYYNFLDSIGAKFLYNKFFDTYTTEPMALLHIAAQLKNANYKVDVVDGIIESLSKEELTKRLLESNCDVFAFTLYDTSEEDIIDIMKEVKKNKPNAVIMTGGPYPTMEYEKILKKYDVIDYITVGDGDQVYINYLNAIKNNESPLNIKNLAYRDENGNVVLTEREVVNLDDQVPTDRMFAQQVIDKGFSLGVNTSRGCAHACCSFCYLKDYQTVSCQPKIRYRSPEKVINELKDLIERFNIDKVTFCDDDFFGTNIEGLKRACEIFKLLIENNIKLDIYVIGRVKTMQFMIEHDMLPLMKQAGVSCVYLGFDSYNDDILKRYQKGCTVSDINTVVSALHENGIRINPGLITFEPVLNIDHVKNNIELFKILGYYDAYMFTRVLVILPQMREKYFNDEELDIYDEEYFRDPQTKRLFEELSKYRDMVLPIYRSIDRNKITEDDRQYLYAEHYNFFDYVYNNLKQEKEFDADEYIAECKNRIEQQIQPICESEYYDERRKEPTLQKRLKKQN